MHQIKKSLCPKVILLAMVTACGSRELKTPIYPTYQSISTLVIAEKCLQCHSSLSTYQGLLQIVTPNNASESSLYEEVKDGGMPLQSPKLSPEEINAIYTWIQNGAQNN